MDPHVLDPQHLVPDGRDLLFHLIASGDVGRLKVGPRVQRRRLIPRRFFRHALTTPPYPLIDAGLQVARRFHDLCARMVEDKTLERLASFLRTHLELSYRLPRRSVRALPQPPGV